MDVWVSKQWVCYAIWYVIVGLYDNVVYTKKILTSDIMYVRENRLSWRNDHSGRPSSYLESNAYSTAFLKH